MKTKILVLFTAILTLSAVTSCVAPYSSSRSFRRPTDSIRFGLGRGPGPSQAAYRGGGLGGKLNRSMGRRPSGNRSSSLGGYRGGGAGGGFGGSFGGFGTH